MVKRIIALLTIAIELGISAAQGTNQGSSYTYYQPETYQTSGAFNKLDDHKESNQHYATYTRSNDDVTQSNDIFNFNKNNFGEGNNGLPEVTSSSSRALSIPAEDYRKNVDWDANIVSYERFVTSDSNSQESEAMTGNNDDDQLGGISITGSNENMNFLSSTTPSSRFNYDSGLERDSDHRGRSENSADVSSSIQSSLTTLNSNNLSGSQGKFDNIFRTKDGKLVKLVEISDDVRDIENLIPRKSQVLKRIEEHFLQKSLELANGASGNTNNFKGLFGGKVNSANIIVGTSKNLDVTDIVNGKSNVVNNVVNGFTGKAAEGGLLQKAETFSNVKKSAIDRSVNSVTGNVEGIKEGLMDMTRSVASAKNNKIHDTVNIVSGKVGSVKEVAYDKANAVHGTVDGVTEKVKNMKEGLLQKAGAFASAKTNVIRGTVNSVTGTVENVMEGSLNKARDITNTKTNAIRGTVNSITGKVDNINRVLLEKAGVITDAKTGAILGVVNQAADIGDIKGGFLQTAGSIAGDKSGALASFVSASKNIKGGRLEGSGTIGVTQPGTIIRAFSPLNAIGKKFVSTTASTAKSVVNTVSGIKSGALNLTDKIIHPGKYYGISAMKRKVVNDILDDAQDEFQNKIGNVVETLSGIGEGVKNHVSDLSIIDNNNKNILKIVNGLYDTQFYLNDSPVEQAYIIFSDENQPVNFFAESLDNQQRIIEECIPTGQVYIAYKPDCVNVEEDERGSQEFITAKNDMKSRLNVIVDNIFEKYGNQIIRKAVSVTNGRL